MRQITLRFLGTGTSQGIPVLGSDHPVCMSLDPRDKRQRTSALIRWDDCAVGIDCGPDFRNQMLAAGQKKLDALLFTHEHADHTAGLDDIRPYYFQKGYFPIYAATRVIDSLKERFAYILQEENKYPGAPSVQINEIEASSFDLFGLAVTPLNAPHGPIEVTGFRVGGLAYFTDVKSMPEQHLDQLKGLDILVINALRHEPHHSHLSLSEAIALAQEIGAKKTYFTHISHHLGFHKAVQKTLPAGIFLAYDGLEVEATLPI